MLDEGPKIPTVQLLADDTKTFQEVDTDVSQLAANQQELQGRIDKI